MELSRRYLTRKLSITEIGGALGGVSISAISQNKRRLEVKRKKDKKLEKKFKKIELSLSKQ
jgi:chromosomal replication initiation ATPase DnaA